MFVAEVERSRQNDGGRMMKSRRGANGWGMGVWMVVSRLSNEPIADSGPLMRGELNVVAEYFFDWDV